MLTHSPPMTSILFLIDNIYCILFICNYLKNNKLFLNFYLYFWNLDQILQILKKKMTLVANVFSKLRTSRNPVRQMSKKYRFRVTLEKEHFKWVQTMLKSERRHVYQIYWSLWSQLSLKKLLLLISNIIGQFVKASCSCAIISKTKKFLWIFFYIFEI